MTRNPIDYSHGDSGTQPGDGNDFAANERPDAQHFDWFWNRVVTGINELWGEFDRIDADNDGRVDAADTSELLKGNDIDTNGDGVVDTADYANDADASTYKGNDLDSDGDGKVDKAVDADNVTGTIKGTDIDTNYHSIEDSGRVTSGDAGLLFQTELADGESMNIYQITFTGSDGSPAPNGLYLSYISLDGSGGSTLEDNTIAGDGSTVFVDETGAPWQSYTNTTGSPQTVAFAVDNGQFNAGAGTDVEMYVSLNMRVE